MGYQVEKQINAIEGWIFVFTLEQKPVRYWNTYFKEEKMNNFSVLYSFISYQYMKYRIPNIHQLTVYWILHNIIIKINRHIKLKIFDTLLVNWQYNSASCKLGDIIFTITSDIDKFQFIFLFYTIHLISNINFITRKFFGPEENCRKVFSY